MGIAQFCEALGPSERFSFASRIAAATQSQPGPDARLESRTHLDQGRYSVTLRDYGKGLAEIGWAFVPTIPFPKGARGESENREANEDRAVRRARSALRHKILSAGTDHLLTLTYRENVVEYSRASHDLTRFIRLVRKQMPQWVYVAVAEQQKRGAWHWHLAVRGRQDVALLRAMWREVVGEGNIDVNPPKGPTHRRQLALVRYLGKYLAKGFTGGEREFNARRFRSSIGIRIPGESIEVPAAVRARVDRYVAERLKEASGQLGHMWVSPDRTSGWACSWG